MLESVREGYGLSQNNMDKDQLVLIKIGGDRSEIKSQQEFPQNNYGLRQKKQQSVNPVAKKENTLLSNS